MENSRLAIRLHLTNIIGAGAVQLANSLIPALVDSHDLQIDEVFLPDRGLLPKALKASKKTKITIYQRLLPKIVSRVLECTILSKKFEGTIPLFVMGDLPLRISGPQILFLQNSFLITTVTPKWFLTRIKTFVMRKIFQLNLERVDAFIVQSDYMKSELLKRFPLILENKVFVISQPVPQWLLNSELIRSRPIRAISKLNLIYPALKYPHKNHDFLLSIPRLDVGKSPIESLYLTIPKDAGLVKYLPFIRCVDFLSEAQMIEKYTQVDALLFLSLEESYGFPLVEAMFIGIPIICPDLPYAKGLCGDNAIYFDINSTDSFLDALHQLIDRLNAGWWPDWANSMKNMPADWNAAAAKIIEVLFHVNSNAALGRR